LRKNLAHNLNLRVTPRLTFFYDDSIRRGQVISRLINDAIAADTENKTDET
jgi:ribosome-binding factor A